MQKRFPFIMQRDAMDCGPSSLAMIARYYGRRLDLERLRSECFLARDGVSLLGISKAAEKTDRYRVEIALGTYADPPPFAQPAVYD